MKSLYRVFISVNKSVQQTSTRFIAQQYRHEKGLHEGQGGPLSISNTINPAPPNRPKNYLELGEENLADLQIIERALGVNDKQAKAILKKCPQIKGKIESLSPTLNFLKSKVPLTRICRHPWLLLKEPDAIQAKADEVMAILDIQEFGVALPFVNLKSLQLQAIATLWKTESKIEPELRDRGVKSRLEFLSLVLECPAEEVADIMVQVVQLKSMPFCRLREVVTTLLDGGVRKEDIRSDPWIFDHNLDTMKERLAKSQSRGLSVIKPWILRSPQTKFENHVNRKVAEDALLKGHKDVGSFLQQKLGCSKLTAKEILSRVPSIKKASAVKLNEMIQFLYSQGFTADHIVETPRILGHSVETIASRCKELSGFDYQPYSLLVLCKTSKHYSTFIRRLGEDSSAPVKKPTTEI